GVDTRTVLALDRRLAPFKAAVLPLSRNADLSPKARDLAAQLRKNWNVDFDDAQAIGRRYRRHDEIGTPFCVTVDFDTLEDQAVTIRERDTMAQHRCAIDQVEGCLAQRLLGCCSAVLAHWPSEKIPLPDARGVPGPRLARDDRPAVVPAHPGLHRVPRVVCGPGG